MYEEFEELTTLPLDKIIPYENNPRLNDDAVPFVYNSIKTFGYISKIAVNQDGVILSGHTRLKALRQLYEDGEFDKGYLKAQGITADAIPVRMLHFKTENEEMMYRLADNKVAEKSGWDFDMLDDLLPDLKADFDLANFGFDFDLWGGDEMEEDEVVSRDASKEKPAAAEAQAEPRIYEPARRIEALDRAVLGRHLLVCKEPVKEDVEADAEDESYFVLASSDGAFEAGVVCECAGCCGVFRIGDASSDDRADFVRDLFYEGQWAVSDMLQWEKPVVPDLSASHVAHSMDTIVVYGHPEADYSLLDRGVCDEGTLLGLYAWLIKAYTRKGQTVVDLTGAERDMIAICESLGRRCVCYCPDPEVCDCIVADWDEAHPDSCAAISHGA